MDRATALDGWMRGLVTVFDHGWPGLPRRPERAVVGADGSAPSRDAALWGAAVARQVHLVFGMRAYLAPGAGPMTPSMAKHIEDALRADATAAIRPVQEAINVAASDVHIQRDTPGHALVDVAKKVSAPLLCVGATGKGRFEKAVLGSVSEGLAHHAPISTLVARTPPRQGPIVVGVSDDPGSLEAAAWGAGLAVWLDRRLVVAHAAPEGVTAKGFPSTGARAEAKLVGWPARDALVRLAHDESADLVVVGHAGMPSWLGGTAMGVLRHAECSVLVARPWEPFGG